MTARCPVCAGPLARVLPFGQVQEALACIRSCGWRTPLMPLNTRRMAAATHALSLYAGALGDVIAAEWKGGDRFAQARRRRI